MITGGAPGKHPRIRSSKLGLRAAVIATESPSQPSPLVSQRTCTGSRSAATMVYAIVRRALRRTRRRSLGQRRLALGQDLELVLEAVVQVEVVGGPGHEPGLREALQRVRDRRALGRHQLAEQAVRERQRQPDAARLDAPPSGGEVPQEQDQANLEPRLRGDRAQHVELERAPARAPGEDPGDLRERTHALGEVAVEHRELRRAQHAPPARAHDQLIRGRSERLKQIAGADQLGGGATADPDLERDQTVEDEQPEALPRGIEPGRQVARPDPDLEDPGGGELPGRDPRADVELLGDLPVGVEQVGVERDRLRRVAGQPRMAGPPQGPGLDTSVFDGQHTLSCGLSTSRRIRQSMPRDRAPHRHQILVGNPGLPAFTILHNRVVEHRACAWRSLARSLKSSMT